METKRLSDDTFYPVSVHCPARFLLYTDAQPVPGQVIFTPDKRKALAMESSAGMVHPVKLPVFAQQAFLAQRITGHT